MEKTTKEQKKMRIYLMIMGALAFILLLILVKNSLLVFLEDGRSSAQSGSFTYENTLNISEESLLPLVWTRKVFAGELISDDMFQWLEHAQDKQDKSQTDFVLEEAILSVRGRYVKENYSGGTQISQNALTDEMPLSPSKGNQAIWVKLSEKQDNAFNNFVLGEFVAAYEIRVLEENPLPIEGLEKMRILALNREANSLCLELSAQQQLSLLALQFEAAVYYLPTLGIEQQRTEPQHQSDTTADKTTSETISTEVKSKGSYPLISTSTASLTAETASLSTSAVSTEASTVTQELEVNASDASSSAETEISFEESQNPSEAESLPLSQAADGE